MFLIKEVATKEMRYFLHLFGYVRKLVLKDAYNMLIQAKTKLPLRSRNDKSTYKQVRH